MNDDFRDLLSALNAAEARFVIVGAYAVAVHGRPRATGDLDVWVEATPTNAARAMEALVAFGAPLTGLTESDLATPGTGLQMGVEPRRIDILTRVSGLSFEDAWPRRLLAFFGGVRCPVIGLEDLLTNKRAAGRPKDLADVDALDRVLRPRLT